MIRASLEQCASAIIGLTIRSPAAVIRIGLMTDMPLLLSQIELRRCLNVLSSAYEFERDPAHRHKCDINVARAPRRNKKNTRPRKSRELVTSLRTNTQSRRTARRERKH